MYSATTDIPCMTLCTVFQWIVAKLVLVNLIWRRKVYTYTEPVSDAFRTTLSILPHPGHFTLPVLICSLIHSIGKHSRLQLPSYTNSAASPTPRARTLRARSLNPVFESFLAEFSKKSKRIPSAKCQMPLQ